MKDKAKSTRGSSTTSTNRRSRNVQTIELQIMAFWPLLSIVFTILCGLALANLLKLAKNQVNVLYLRV